MRMIARLSALTVAAVLSAGGASANTYTDVLGEFNYDGEAPYPTAEQFPGTFLFSIPGTETITSATVSGTFGNSQVANSAGVDL